MYGVHSQHFTVVPVKQVYETCTQKRQYVKVQMKYSLSNDNITIVTSFKFYGFSPSANKIEKNVEKMTSLTN